MSAATTGRGGTRPLTAPSKELRTGSEGPVTPAPFGALMPPKTDASGKVAAVQTHGGKSRPFAPAAARSLPFLVTAEYSFARRLHLRLNFQTQDMPWTPMTGSFFRLRPSSQSPLIHVQNHMHLILFQVAVPDTVPAVILTLTLAVLTEQL